MIRHRLRITLLMILAVVMGLGFGSIWLVRTHTSRFDRLLEKEHQSMMRVNSIIFHTSLLSDYLIPALADPDQSAALAGDPVIKELVDGLREQSRLLQERREDANGNTAISRVGALVQSLLSRIESVRSDDPLGDAARRTVSNSIMQDTRAIARVAEEVIGAIDARVSVARQSFGRHTRDALLYVSLLIAIAIAVLILIYWQFNSLALAPLAALTDSVREVGRRNFELSLPADRNDEIGHLSRAYNDMAAELRRLRRETDEHIVALNAQNRTLLTAFPHAVLVVDATGKLNQINTEAEEFLSGVGTPGRLPVKLKKLFEMVRDGGEDHLPNAPDEALLFRIDEKEFYYLPRIIALPPVEDLPDRWAIVMTDVTRFRWLDDMKMNALSTVSHELRTPLTSIRMVLHLLLEKKIGSLTETQDEMISSASGDCERLVESLNNLLEVSRLTSGSKHLDVKAVTPADLLSELPPGLEEKARDKQVSIVVKENGALPLVLADRPRISQVITNFLSNAVKFSPPGSTVTLEARKEGPEHVRFVVTDTGSGVPPEAQDRLFERFYRAPGQNAKGMGLGLSISREILAAHNGRIGFLSEDDAPTAFYFDLPLA